MGVVLRWWWRRFSWGRSVGEITLLWRKRERDGGKIVKRVAFSFNSRVAPLGFPLLKRKIESIPGLANSFPSHFSFLLHPPPPPPTPHETCTK